MRESNDESSPPVSFHLHILKLRSIFFFNSIETCVHITQEMMLYLLHNYNLDARDLDMFGMSIKWTLII